MDAPPSFTSFVSDELTNSIQQPPSVGSVAMAKVQVSQSSGDSFSYTGPDGMEIDSNWLSLSARIPEDGPPSFTSFVARTQFQISDELIDGSYNNEQPPSVGSVARAKVQVSDQLSDTSHNNEQAPSMTMVNYREHSQSSSESFSYTGPDQMEIDSNWLSLSARILDSGVSIPKDHSSEADWRAQLQPDSRQRIVNKILDTLKQHLPYSGHEGLQELKKIALRFEEKIYTAATSQSDYLRKMSLKLLTMENGSQNPMTYPMQSNSAANSVNPLVPLDYASQTSNTNGGDWQDEVYQKGASGVVPDPTLDWRAELQADSRQRIVNKILATLKQHLPYSGHEGLQELKKIAVRFEEKIYTAATSQSDYLRKISLKMLTMENGSQNPMTYPMQSNSAANSVNPLVPLDYASQTSNTNGGARQDEVYQKGASGVVPDPTLDWRAELQADSRQRIVNKILATLKKHLPYPDHEGLQELKKIAVRFEEKNYTAATSQSDYLRKISLKMLTMEARSQNPLTSLM